MLLLKYSNENKKYPVSFNTITKNIVQLTGDFPIRTDGFELSRFPEDADAQMDKSEAGKFWDGWDYSQYTTVYREIEGGVQFSNDGSVYVESEPDINAEDIKYALPLSNKELTECVADLMYEVSCIQLGL